jgi:alpha-beta hydrolase superfamily lysophospholipase
MRRVAWVGVGIAGLVLAIGTGWVLSRPPTPDAFYSSVSASGAPGTLLAVEPYFRDVPEAADAWRILYTTTRIDDTKAVASAVVMAPKGALGPLDAIGWAHGTKGIAPGCAPSVEWPFADVPVVDELLAAGWAYVATDYVGLGTEGGHAYLVGEDAARAVMDSLRAAQEMEAVEIGARSVVWGHSQGGNSALWVAQMAQDYAPELDIVGMAALAPASDMPALVETVRGSLFGKVVSSYLLEAYARTYADVRVEGYVGFPMSWLVRDMASRCAVDARALLSLAQAMLFPSSGIFDADPIVGPLADRLAENVPNGPFAMPVMIGQGSADEIVAAKVQTGYVDRLCGEGKALDYQLYEGLDHLSLVRPGTPLEDDLIAWSDARFRGEDVKPSCGAL